MVCALCSSLLLWTGWAGQSLILDGLDASLMDRSCASIDRFETLVAFLVCRSRHGVLVSEGSTKPYDEHLGTSFQDSSIVERLSVLGSPKLARPCLHEFRGGSPD